MASMCECCGHNVAAEGDFCCEECLTRMAVNMEDNDEVVIQAIADILSRPEITKEDVALLMAMAEVK